MIKDIIINYLPAFVLGFVFIFCTFKYIGTFKDMSDSIKQNSSYKKIEDDMKALLNENYDLRKDNKELKAQFVELLSEFKKLSEKYELTLKEKKEE
jgi:cell shape-determining protein MreC